MKKSLKLRKSYLVVACVTAFLVVCGIVVYASGFTFKDVYGSGNDSVTKDNVLSKTDWNSLMADLDALYCPPQSCPEQSCPTSCGTTYYSPDKRKIFHDLNNLGMYGDSATSVTSTITGVPDAERDCPSGYEKSWYGPHGDRISSTFSAYKGMGTKLCGVLGSTVCSDVKGKYFNIPTRDSPTNHSKGQWYKIYVEECANNIIGFTVSAGGNDLVTPYGVSWDLFSSYEIVKK